MDETINQPNLLAALRVERQSLDALLAAISPARMGQPPVTEYRPLSTT